jgi:hypothetical protein
MVLRLTALTSVAIIAATALYVVHDRSHLAAEIHNRRAAYASCLRANPGSSAIKRHRRAHRCDWSTLAAAREGDLLGVPFFALAVLLSVILVLRITIAKPEPSDSSGIDVTSTVVPE